MKSDDLVNGIFGLVIGKLGHKKGLKNGYLPF